MDFKKVIGKGIKGLFAGAVASIVTFLSSGTSAEMVAPIVDKVIPEQVGAMTVNAVVVALVVAGMNFLKHYVASKAK